MAISDKVESPPMVVDGEELLLDATRPVYDPATGEGLAHAPEATAEHADAAVAAAIAPCNRPLGLATGLSLYALEEYTADEHVVFERTGAPRKAWYDAVSSRAEKE
jgi:hypothetical protein